MCFSNLRRENRILEKKLAEEKQLFKEEQERNADNKAEALMVRYCPRFLDQVKPI